MIAPARRAAYDVVSAVSAGRADLPSALARARASLPDERDRALTAEIATGVQRWRAALDHVIEAGAKRRASRLDAEILDILRLSAYQLLYLSRIPAAAVVDDAVDLAGRAGKRSAQGFVNAVLRTLSRTRAHLPLPPRPVSADDRDAVLDYLSITLSHPRWLAARWLDRFGFEAAEAWLQFDNQVAPVTLRTNRLRTTTDALVADLAAYGVSVSRGRYAPDALIVDARSPLRRPGGLLEGAFVVQDEASQLVVALAGVRAGTRVLDTCASPGNKTTAFAAAAGPLGRVVACDVRERRIELLHRTIAAAGASNVWIVQADLLSALPFLTSFDLVVVDAPCSGLGTLRRDPDIRWRRTPDDLRALAASQRAMLRHAAAMVSPGGRLVYATCSSEPEENEQVAQHFLEDAPDFRAIAARTAGPDIPAAVVDERGHLRTRPDVHGLEAFFGAAFERRREL